MAGTAAISSWTFEPSDTSQIMSKRVDPSGKQGRGVSVAGLAGRCAVMSHLCCHHAFANN